MGRNHMYLTAIIDWYSRYIVGWELSDTLDTAPVLAALKGAISRCGQKSLTVIKVASLLVTIILCIYKLQKSDRAWMAKPAGLIMLS